MQVVITQLEQERTEMSRKVYRLQEELKRKKIVSLLVFKDTPSSSSLPS